MSATDRGGQYRLEVYKVIQKAIARDLTPEEATTIKTALLEYAKSEAEHFRQSLQKVNDEHKKIQDAAKEKIKSLERQVKGL